MKIKHIAAATDLSEPSLAAVERGFIVARDTDARYSVVHAIGLDALAQLKHMLGIRADNVAAAIASDARSSLEQLLQRACGQTGQSAEFHLENDSAMDAIPAFCQQNDVDLVLLGARGVGLMSSAMLGSTAARLLLRSKCPVMVVKAETKASYRRILVAVDFSPASELAVRAARAVAPQAEILLLHVYEVPFEGKLRLAGVGDEVISQFRGEAHERAMQEMHVLASKEGLDRSQYTAIACPGDATREIIAHSEQHRCDAIAIGKHGTRLTEELILGSVAKRVINEAACDVLVVMDRNPPKKVHVTP